MHPQLRDIVREVERRQREGRGRTRVEMKDELHRLYNMITKGTAGGDTFHKVLGELLMEIDEQRERDFYIDQKRAA